MTFAPLVPVTYPYPVTGYPDMFTGGRSGPDIYYFGGPFPDNISPFDRTGSDDYADH